ncbi:serine hydrolase domain-containing protein [Nonomuraea glycinis]|uniref:serine hydrolase domain-containing protein n=1 Tax=Nonomuraea glycinis TaxID=2047744 RepID=UPI002E136D5B|nr:beta-lactamase family protein [Nonomuraea glycinis]
MRLRDRTAALTSLAGYGVHDPLMVGVQQDGTRPVFLTSGRTAAGEPLTADTIAYTASLSKQITAACAALLVRQGKLDTESIMAQWMPELPTWAGTVRVRHLISHTSGLPEGIEFDDLHRAKLDHTSAGVIHALARLDHLVSTPGTEHRYCNAGYICLAAIIERAASRPLPDFAREHVFTPLGMTSSQYWSGPAPHPPGAVPLDSHYPAPLSIGDGGVWSTAPDLIRWNQALERDELRVSALLQTPGHLDDGTQLDYAWALGVREHAGQRIYRHGGSWAGLNAQLVRLADQRAGFVIIALDDDRDRTATLTQAMIEELTTQSRTSQAR